MVKKTCGIMNSNDKVLTAIEPTEELKVNWDNSNVMVKERFYKEWKEAYDLLESDMYCNQGLNILSVLDEMGYRINVGIVEKDMSFDDLYGIIVKEFINEM